jgi:uncharacterized membrane protein
MSETTQKQAEVRVKPLSKCTFLAFFQKIWRWWLGVWYGFVDKKPKLAGIIYKVFFFVIFSEGVTIWQFVVMTFLPHALAGLGTDPWGWPGISLSFCNGAQYIILGDTNGLGYFIAFELAVFTAQCINFPLQRNITYKSKGNPWWQAMWYFIGWVVISIATNAIWGLINAVFTGWDWYNTPGLDVVAGLIKTVLTGGLSMVVFFFIFLVIFPDRKKAAENAKKKVETLKAKGATQEEIAVAQEKAIQADQAYRLDEARKNVIATGSLANSKASVWQAVKDKAEKMKAGGKASAEEIASAEKMVTEKYADALEAAQKRDDAIAENEAVIAQVDKERAA